LVFDKSVFQVPSNGDWAGEDAATNSAAIENSAQSAYRLVLDMSMFLLGEF
jgi:hypothetical protein